MSQITREAVIDAVKKVEVAGLKEDLAALNTIKDVQIQGNNIKVSIELPHGLLSQKESIHGSCMEMIKREIAIADAIIVNITEAKADTPHQQTNGVIPGVKNTIAVASGKGGVGKSTVAVNLAVALAKQGFEVGLLDADIYGPSIPLMLGIQGKPQISQDPVTGKMVPLESFGVKLMSIGFLVDDNTPVIWRGPMASGAAKQFLSDVNWGELDFLILDLPPGTGDIQLTLVQTIPLTGSVIVTTPQSVSLIDARKGLQMFNRVNVPVFGIVENMSYFIAPDTGNRYDIFGHGGGEALAEELNVSFLGGIPIDPRIREGGDLGNPIVHHIPDSKEAEKINEISTNLVERVNTYNTSSSQDVEIEL